MALYGDQRFYFQQDGAPPHYHNRVTEYLKETLPGRWIDRRGAAEYPPRSPDLTPLEFYLWGTLKDSFIDKNHAHWMNFKMLEHSCADIQLDTFQSVVRAGVQQHRLCEDVNCDHFEHLQHRYQ